ncbi:hypothetical protein KC19_1G280800 [Ceratodon purpureus]|uniref:tRNA-5-taurinomethyluridine 2-sulfurtransferase n=3 Tax=Ceratodon purpureus TaxID=3225 RepID=A0A8T0JAL5_CERPU|nr:hypothetical protein KC19_1G280800 [Ceratodon purpureus]
MMGHGGRGLVRPFKRVFAHVLKGDGAAWDPTSCGGFASSGFSTLSQGRRGVVAVGMSGGVDSSVAALLLQRQGYEVFGVYMRNWDSRDEAGGGHCTADQDYEDSQRVCKHLGIKLHHLDYQKQYWTQVFETFTQKFAMGLTPNPDLACNQHIKFDALLENALQMGADKLATGHYARLCQPQSGGPVQLLRGIDENKDQSYFLANVGADAFEKVLFPLGTLTKADVRNLAVSEGLVTATKRSSAGICFVGRRDFRDFISEYVEMKPGPFVCVDGNSHLGTHTGIAAYTHGQRAGISGVPKPFYVVGKNVENNTVFVAPGADHPALFCTSAVAGDPFWISGQPPKVLQDGQPLTCMFKARYRQSLEKCTVCFVDSNTEEAIAESMGVAGTETTEFASSSFCRVRHTLDEGKRLLQIRFEDPTRAITPGQALVLYDGDVCLGASVIAYPGPSLFEQNQLHEEDVQVSVSV